MPSDPDTNLEAFIHERLRQLPPRSAPPTLAPRVTSAIVARAGQPWWLRSWWDWPLAARAALVVAALLVLGVLMGSNLLLSEAFSAVSQFVSRQAVACTGYWSDFRASATIFTGYWTQFVEPLVMPALLVALLLYLLSMGCGTALVRLAWKRS